MARAEEARHRATVSTPVNPTPTSSRNYGEYEGLTPNKIQERAAGWLIFRDGCPGGESLEQIGARVDRVIARFTFVN